MYLRKCKACGTGFSSHRKNQVFCNSKCRNEYGKASATPEVEKTCPNCLHPFKTRNPKKQKFCSDKCRIEDQHKRLHHPIIIIKMVNGVAKVINPEAEYYSFTTIAEILKINSDGYIKFIPRDVTELLASASES